METDDWRLRLEGLRGSLPDSGPAEAPPSAETAGRVKSAALNVVYERKGRAGKPATIIEGFADEAQASAIASRLKSRLAVGGSARGCEVLLQGDQRPRLAPALAALGFARVKGLGK